MVASLGRCLYGSDLIEVSQRTAFVRAEQYLTFVKAELGMVGSHPGERLHVENKVRAEQKAKCCVVFIL